MLGWCAVLIKVYFFFENKLALLQLLHSCNSFLGGQSLHIAIFNTFLATIAIAIAIVLMAIANALFTTIFYTDIFTRKDDLPSSSLKSRVGKISHFSSLARLRDYIVKSREICETCETMKIEYLLSIIVQKLIKNLNSK